MEQIEKAQTRLTRRVSAALLPLCTMENASRFEAAAQQIGEAVSAEISVLLRSTPCSRCGFRLDE